MCIKVSVSDCEWMVLKENDKKREWERWGREKGGKIRYQWKDRIRRVWVCKLNCKKLRKAYVGDLEINKRKKPER